MPRNNKTVSESILPFIKSAENKAPLLCLTVMVLMILSVKLMPLFLADIGSANTLVAAYLISFLLPCAVFGVIFHKKTVFNFSAPVKGCVKFTVASAFLLVSAAILTKCIVSYVTGTDSSQTSAFLSDAGLFESLLCYTVIPSLLEELVFRGIGFSMYRKTCGGFGAIFASSVFFGISHFSGAEFFSYCVSGIILGTVVYITRSVYPAMILHFVNNTVSFFLENAVFKVASESKSGMLAIFLVTAITLIILFWFLYELENICKKRYLSSPKNEEYETSDLHELSYTLQPYDGDIITSLKRVLCSPLFITGIIGFAVYIAIV